MTRITFDSATGDIPLDGVLITDTEDGQKPKRWLVVSVENTSGSPHSGSATVVPATWWRMMWLKVKRWWRK